jgi:predicted nucleic acid-binding protein
MLCIGCRITDIDDSAGTEACRYYPRCVLAGTEASIAAHAQAWNLTLVTNNNRHFAGIKDLQRVDWTKPQVP